MSYCKGICVRFKAKKEFAKTRYGIGQVRCQICDMWLKPEGVRNFKCLCCGFFVRTKSRNAKYKEKLRAKIMT